MKGTGLGYPECAGEDLTVLALLLGTYHKMPLRGFILEALVLSIITVFGLIIYFIQDKPHTVGLLELVLLAAQALLQAAVLLQGLRQLPPLEPLLPFLLHSRVDARQPQQ